MQPQLRTQLQFYTNWQHASKIYVEQFKISRIGKIMLNRTEIKDLDKQHKELL